MRRPLPSSAPWWVVASAIAGASAALALPGPEGPATGIAAVMAVGVVALLAGHSWGMLITGTAQVLLLGQVWPVLALRGGGDLLATVAAAVAVATALPAIGRLRITVPAVVDLLLGEDRSERTRGVGVTCGAMMMALALVLPAV